MIGVVGLNKFVKSLKTVDSKLPSELRKRMNVSANIVVEAAKPKVPVVSGTARGSIKARSTTKTARVIGGGNKAPYFGWIDFGGYGGTNKKNYRTIEQDGRYIYPAYFEHRDEFFADLERGLVELTERAGLDVD